MFDALSAVIKSKMKGIHKMDLKPKDRIFEKTKENPELKEKLINFSKDFEKLSDPWIFNIVANLATFEKLAEFANVEVKELLEYLNTGIKTVSEESGKEQEKPDWVNNHEFVEIDARKLSGFFLKDILNQEANLPENTGLKVIQNFLAAPLITLLEGKGYTAYTEKLADDLYNFYFLKLGKEKKIENVSVASSGKPQMVIQSATPVVYPVLLKLLQSEEIKKHVEVTEYKVWEETEKHLGWIVSGKADLSFSAVLAMSNLASNKDIVKLTNITVWDNFHLLTRGYKAESWTDIKGHDIHMPLFFNAPPAKVTNYLMEENGFNPDDFSFVFGKPFGRPEDIYKDLVEGKIDTALLREPEVSYALVNNPEISVAFSYNDLWQKIHPKSKGLPNAGVVFKSEWFEKYPDEAKLVMKEIDKAVAWVKANPKEATELSYKEMGHSFDEVYKFLTRVHFENVLAQDVEKEIVDYLSVIDGEEKATMAINKMLYRENKLKIEINF
jgi:NitT/TauT family transport system substrate-binding protein